MGNILLKAEDSPLSEVNWLVNDGTKDLSIIKLLITLSGLVNLWSFQNSSLNGVRLEVDIKVPLLDLLGVSNHSVELFDASNSLWRFLEEALSDVGHNSFIFSDFGGDSDKGAKLWWEIDVLSLLTNFKQRLILRLNLNAIGCLEVVNHNGSGLVVTLIKDVVFGVHVPLDLMDLVSSVWPVLSHDDGTLELSIDESCIVSHTSIGDQCQAMINGEELRNVIYNQIETLLENPGRGEESRPSFDRVLECLCLGWHEESGVFTNLAELGVSQTVLDDAVDELKSNWMVLHFGVVKVVKQESRAFFNHDGVISTIEWRGGL
jgi:hypothetical protein